MDINILDVSSGGALVDKIIVATKTLIENMSLNSQQFTTRNNYVVQTKRVHAIQVSSSNKALKSRLDELASLLKQLALSKAQTERLCDICTSSKHPTNIYPTLQEGVRIDLPKAYMENIYNPQRNNHYRHNTPDPSTNR